MNCQFEVYRVVQSTSPDLEGKEGPILPTEDWVEKEVLKTLTGRVEVHKDCLVSTIFIPPSRDLNLYKRPERLSHKQSLSRHIRRLSESCCLQPLNHHLNRLRNLPPPPVSQKLERTFRHHLRSSFLHRSLHLILHSLTLLPWPTPNRRRSEGMLKRTSHLKFKNSCVRSRSRKNKFNAKRTSCG